MSHTLVVSEDIAQQTQQLMASSGVRIHASRHLPPKTAFLLEAPDLGEMEIPPPRPLMYILCHTRDRWLSYSSVSRDWSTLCGIRWAVFQCELWQIPDAYEPCEDWAELDQDLLRLEYLQSLRLEQQLERPLSARCTPRASVLSSCSW